MEYTESVELGLSVFWPRIVRMNINFFAHFCAADLVDELVNYSSLKLLACH